MRERNGQSRCRYVIYVGGIIWCQAKKWELAKAAAEHAGRTWAKGKRVEIRDMRSGEAAS